MFDSGLLSADSFGTAHYELASLDLSSHKDEPLLVHPKMKWHIKYQAQRRIEDISKPYNLP